MVHSRTASMPFAVPSALPKDLSAGMQVAWADASGTKPLHTWGVEELFGHVKGKPIFKHYVAHERDPETGKVEKWDGVLLSQLVDETIDPLPLDRKAQVDLVALWNSSGARVVVPRALITRYPVLLAYDSDSESATAVVPWTSRPKILNEDVPVENLFMKDVVRIELANYQDRFGGYFLRRRTDPAAVRGEKLFVQNCMTCHATGHGPYLRPAVMKPVQEAQEGAWHTRVKGVPNLSGRDLRSLDSYLDAFRSENPVQAAEQHAGEAAASEIRR